MLSIPTCQGSGVLHPAREMKLTHETETFWCFTCSCGCVRAFSKPSVKAEATYRKETANAERIRQLQARPTREYSFGGH